MTMLVIGGTGTVGSALVEHLERSDIHVRVMTRTPEKHRFGGRVEAVGGDLTDLRALRAAMSGVRTLFLLVAVCPDELTQALTALNVAEESGVQNIVYLSVPRSDVFTNVPHFAAKHACERMIASLGVSAAILRVNYFMQNDAMLRDALCEHGVYPMPIGAQGLSMIDIRDIAELAARELLIREQGDAPEGADIIEVSGPDVINGVTAAELWTKSLSRQIYYAGDDLDVWEQALRQKSPSWFAYDMRLMMERFQRCGLKAEPQACVRLVDRLGRPLRTYQNFVEETSSAWLSPQV